MKRNPRGALHDVPLCGIGHAANAMDDRACVGSISPAPMRVTRGLRSEGVVTVIGNDRAYGRLVMHPFGVSEEDWRKLEHALGRLATLAKTERDWFRGEPSRAEEFLLLQARVNALVPPGTIP